MRFLLFGLLLTTSTSVALGQQPKKQREEDFVNQKPRVGDTVPELTVYDPNGKEVKTTSLRGHYTVLTFGCLT